MNHVSQALPNRWEGDWRATFSRHRRELPLLIAFLSVATVELLAVHFVASQWNRTVAWLFSAATALFLLQIGMLIRGLTHWPTTMDDDGVMVRLGRRRSMFVPYGQVSGSADVSLAPLERGPNVLKASIIAHPNVALRLNGPAVQGRRSVTTILMSLDEPSRFHNALRERLPVPEETHSAVRRTGLGGETAT